LRKQLEIKVARIRQTVPQGRPGADKKSSVPASLSFASYDARASPNAPSNASLGLPGIPMVIGASNTSGGTAFSSKTPLSSKSTNNTAYQRILTIADAARFSAGQTFSTRGYQNMFILFTMRILNECCLLFFGKARAVCLHLPMHKRRGEQFPLASIIMLDINALSFFFFFIRPAAPTVPTMSQKRQKTSNVPSQQVNPTGAAPFPSMGLTGLRYYNQPPIALQPPTAHIQGANKMGSMQSARYTQFPTQSVNIAPAASATPPSAAAASVQRHNAASTS
jgi:hypothetical protein